VYPAAPPTIERVGVGLVQWRPGLQARREVGIGERPLADRRHIGPARLDIGTQRLERAARSRIRGFDQSCRKSANSASSPKWNRWR
jgi:hypothetical protein